VVLPSIDRLLSVWCAVFCFSFFVCLFFVLTPAVWGEERVLAFPRVYDRVKKKSERKRKEWGGNPRPRAIEREKSHAREIRFDDDGHDDSDDDDNHNDTRFPVPHGHEASPP
jgi:hypothetical protein